jgi:hypothetical protein
MRLFNKVFMRESTHPQVREGTPSMLFVISVFAILSLLGGLFVAGPMGLVRAAVTQIVAR